MHVVYVTHDMPGGDQTPGIRFDRRSWSERTLCIRYEVGRYSVVEGCEGVYGQPKQRHNVDY